MKSVKNAPHILLVILITLISYGQTIFMYFWQDDSALIFKLQHQAEIAGSFGAGLFDRGPYRYLVVPFVPFFPFFNLNPLGYFFVGFLTYLLLVATFYWMAISVFKNKKTAYLSTLICAAGYIGSDTMFRVINSWQTNLGIILGLIVFGLYFRFFRKLNYKYYFLSLIVYVCAIEFVFIRSHAVLATIIGIEIAYLITDKISINKIFKSLLRLVPFFVLFGVWYLKDASFGAPGIKSLFTEIIIKHEWTLLMPLTTNVGNILLPDKITSHLLSRFNSSTSIGITSVVFFSIFVVLIYKSKFLTRKGLYISLILFYIALFAVLTAYSMSVYYFRDFLSLGGSIVSFAALSIAFGYLISNNKKALSIAVIVGFVTIMAQIGSYYIQYPTAIFGTTHRYFSYAFIGYAILIGVILENIKKNDLKLIILGVIIVPALFFGWNYQHQILVTRSEPTRRFYSNLVSYIPNLKKGSILYFDVDKDPSIQNQFGNFFGVGSMPDSTALAIYYNIDRYDVTLVTDPNELFYLLSKEPKDSSFNNLYTLRYGVDGLKNTTNEMRSMLLSSKTSDIRDSSPLYTYKKLSFTAQATWSKYTLGKKSKSININDIVNVLKVQNEEKEYYRSSKATSESEWKTREIEYLTDNNKESTWQGHRIHWYDKKHDQITIDLSKSKNISSIKWINWKQSLTPVTYSILTSQDQKNWSVVKKIENGGEKKDAEETILSFPSTNARFVRMDITKTLTDDSPAITEFIVYEKTPEIFTNAILSASAFPFDYVSNLSEWNLIQNASSNLAPLSVNIETSALPKNESISITPILVNGKPHSFDVIIPPGGLNIKNIKVESTYPVNMVLSDFKLQSMSLSDMQKEGLIRRFSEN